MNARFAKLARQPFVVMPAVAMVAFGGWYAAAGRGSSGGGTNAPTEQVVEVTVGTIAKTVTAQGVVAATESDDLSFTSSGTVTAVNVKAGQTVAAGDVLATLDSPALRQAVADAQARLASAKATLADDTTAGASASRLSADSSNVKSAQDALDQATENLAGATLKAPYAGKVTSVGVTVGEKLGSDGKGATNPTGSDTGTGLSNNNLGGNGNPNTAAVSLVSLNTYTIDLGFDANDIDSIAEGQSSKIALTTGNANSGRNGLFRFGPLQATTATTAAPTASTSATATGAVASVSDVADASSGVASYPVTVNFTDDTGSFNVGANVRVDITISEIKDAIQVPVMAIANDGTNTTVTVRDASGKDETRTVKTGETSGAMIQITEGLSAGEQVVVQLPTFGRNNNGNTGPNGASVSSSGGVPTFGNGGPGQLIINGAPVGG